MKNLSVKPRKDDVMISFDMGAEHLTYYVFDDLLKYCQEKEISFERVGFLMAMYDDYKFGKNQFDFESDLQFCDCLGIEEKLFELVKA